MLKMLGKTHHSVYSYLHYLHLHMAYLYRKKRSPFWYVVYIDANTKEVHRSTGLRADDPNDTAKAKALRAELEAKEHHPRPLSTARAGTNGSRNTLSDIAKARLH
jgi:hypothetical protein